MAYSLGVESKIKVLDSSWERYLVDLIKNSTVELSLPKTMNEEKLNTLYI